MDSEDSDQTGCCQADLSLRLAHMPFRWFCHEVAHVFYFCRGKGDYFRLGHGSDAHVRKPSLVEGLVGKKIVHVAVGALHCLAVTDAGQVIHYTFLTKSESLESYNI